MNKKGAFFHWVLLGVIGAIATFFIMSDAVTLSQEVPGEWSFDLLYDGFYTSELQFLERDSTTRVLARDSAVSLAGKGGFSTEPSCGILDDVYKWNKDDDWCVPDSKTNFVSLFKNAFKVKFAHEAENVIVDKEVVKGDGHVLQLDNTLFHTTANKMYTQQYITPYAFTIKTGYDLSEYNTIYQEAQTLVTACGTASNIVECVKQNMGDQWRDRTCITNNGFLTANTRVLQFCVISPSIIDIKYKFALEFTPTTALPVSLTDVTYDSSLDRYVVSFAQDNFAEKYTVYYSDATYLEGRSGKPSDIFNSVLSEFGYFYESNEIQKSNFIDNDNVCNDYVLGDDNKAYLCGDTILYFIADVRLENPAEDEGIVVSVTTTFNNKESDILDVTKHLNS